MNNSQETSIPGIITGFVAVFGWWAAGIYPPVLDVYFPVLLITAAFGLYLLSKNALLNHLVLLLALGGIVVTAVDLTARPLLRDKLYYRPHDRFVQTWTKDSRLSRYQTNRTFKGAEFGDLAAMTGRVELRQPREVEFVTDENGFRNYPETGAQPIDVILLGDSFGFGSGVTQSKTWGSALSDSFKVRTYNLALPGSPWHELMNLKAEVRNIHKHPGTVVLWAIFEGNDLDEDYYPDLEPDTSTGWIKSTWTSFTSFRRRSPVRLILRGLLVNNSRLVEVQTLDDGKAILYYKPYMENLRKNDILGAQHRNFLPLGKVFTEMRAFAQKESLRVAVVLIPDKSRIYPSAFDDSLLVTTSSMSLAISHLCDENGFPFLDLLPGFLNEAQVIYRQGRGFLWWRDDTHWNEEGHRLAARLVFERFLSPLFKSGSSPQGM